MLRATGLLLLRNGEWGYDKDAARQLLWEAQEGWCACCDRRLVPHRRYPRSGDRDTVDHVYPMGFTGPDRLGNIVLLTYKCNRAKGPRWPNRREVQTLVLVNSILGWRTPRMPYVQVDP